MFECKKSKELPFSVKGLYDIVLDVQSYPFFVPWCKKVLLLEKGTDFLIADMTIAFKLLKLSYLSRVTFNIEEGKAHVDVRARSSVFKHLYSRWEFQSLIEDKKTLVSFYNEFEVSLRFAETSIANLYHKAQNEIMDAFEERAYSLLSKR